MSDKRRQYWLQWTDLGEEFIHCDPPGIHFGTDNIDELPELTHVVELQPQERIFSRESLRQWLFNTFLEDANFGVHTIQVIEANLNELFASTETGEK